MLRVPQYKGVNRFDCLQTFMVQSWHGSALNISKRTRRFRFEAVKTKAVVKFLGRAHLGRPHCQPAPKQTKDGEHLEELSVRR